MATKPLFEGVPPDWELTTLGEVCARAGGGIQTGPFGSQLHASDYVPFGVPSIMPENLNEDRISTEGISYITPKDAERLRRYLVQAGDIVYSRRGDVTKRAQVCKQNDGWLCGTGCLRVRFGSGQVNPRFAFYYLGHPAVKQWISRHAIGATLPNLNTSILSAMPFVAPAPNEQTAIADVLGALDDKIELNRRMNETLEAMARAIFKSWFVDFDPVRAKAEGRQPFGMDAATAVLFPDSFQDSPLGKIPKGWKTCKLAEVFNIISGGTPKTSVAEYWDGDIAWFSVADTPRESDLFVIDTEKKITAEGLENSAARLLSFGTTIVTARGTVGKLALVGNQMAMNQSCYGIQARDGHGHYFVRFMLADLMSQLKQSSHGTVFDTITRDTFGVIDAVIPPAELTMVYDQVLTPNLDRILNSLRESRTLAAIREALLPKLISGEIRLKDAAKLAEAKV